MHFPCIATGKAQTPASVTLYSHGKKGNRAIFARAFERHDIFHLAISAQGEKLCALLRFRRRERLRERKAHGQGTSERCRWNQAGRRGHHGRSHRQRLHGRLATKPSRRSVTSTTASAKERARSTPRGPSSPRASSMGISIRKAPTWPSAPSRKLCSSMAPPPS